jgi:hypothetical protein
VNGTTTGKRDNFEGCTYESMFGSFTVGADAPDQTYKLVLDAPKGVKIDFSGFDGALYLRSGTTCSSATLMESTCRDIEGDTENLEIGMLAAGTYWLVVDGYFDGSTATAGAFTLTVQIVEPFCERDLGEGDEAEGEDNDSLANAVGPLGHMENDVDLYICQDDQDWFTMINGGGDISVTARAYAGQTGTLTADLFSVARDAEGVPTGTAITGSTYTDGVLAKTGLPAGEFAVKIAGTGQAAAGIKYAFNVLIACVPDDVEDYYGPNNDLASALGPIGTQDEDVEMALCPGDEDWFTMIHQGGNMTVKVALATGATGTLAPELFSVARDAAGVPTATTVAGTTYASGNLTATALPPGEYAVKVAGTGLATTGTAYLFNVTFSCTAEDGFEYAPNNTALTASGPISGLAAAGIDGGLCPDDVDFLWFSNMGGVGNVVITIEGGANLTVEAYDATVSADSTKLVTVAETVSTTAVKTTSGSNAVVTYTDAPKGANFVVKIAKGASDVPAAGTSYKVKTTFPPPANDTCANAEEVTLPAIGAAAVTVSGSTATAADNGNSATSGCTGSSSGARPDVFYKFTPTANAKVTIRTAGYDTVAYIKSVSCTGTELACNDDENYSGGLVGSLLSNVPVVSGTTYFVGVDSYNAGGNFTIAFTTAAP